MRQAHVMPTPAMTPLTLPERRVPTGAKLSTTSATAVYTNSDARFEVAVRKLIVSNSHSAAVTLTITWFDNSASTTYALYTGYSLASKATLIIDFENMLLAPSDAIRVTAGTANVIECVTITTQPLSRGG